MASLEVERVNDSAVVYQNGIPLMMMPLDVAMRLGRALMQVGALGGDTLDQPR